MSKRAVVLAGGQGSRLRPYTVVLPKPLMPIGDYPILEVILRQLAGHGFDRVTLAVNYQSEIVRAFCGDGSRWGIRITLRKTLERVYQRIDATLKSQKLKRQSPNRNRETNRPARTPRPPSVVPATSAR